MEADKRSGVGDDGVEHPGKKVLKELLDGLDGKLMPKPPDSFDVGVDRIHGALAGLVLPCDTFSLAEGLTLRRTYVHLIAPYILAFHRPTKPRQPHPGSWAALAEAGQDVFVEVALEREARPFSFDRLNSLWLVTTALRIRFGAPLLMPFISDRRLEDLEHSGDASNRIPVELNLTGRTVGAAVAASVDDLLWVRQSLPKLDELIQSVEFYRAVSAFNMAVQADDASAILIAWACIETVIRPGQNQITDRLCKGVATLLTPPGPGRDRDFGVIRDAYRSRGNLVHDGEHPSGAQSEFAIELARRVLAKAIDDRAMPKIADLLDRWKARS